MSKFIKSPVDRFPGEVTLPDFLTMPQVLLYERGIAESRVLIERESTPAEIDAAVLVPICAIVEEWNIRGDHWPEGVISPDTFPGSPRGDSGQLIGWLMAEIRELYNPSIPKE